jgi:Bacterial inner membrane protein
MSHWVEVLGWTATGVFVGSYFFTRATALRGVQMLGALLWATYGLLIKAPPVIVANLLVFSAAAWSLFKDLRRPPSAPT